MKKKNILTTLFSGLTALTLLFVSACKPNETQPPEMVARVDEGKLGYLFTELKPYADRELFALSDGASCVELARLDLKRIIRPMYPLDEFEFKA